MKTPEIIFWKCSSTFATSLHGSRMPKPTQEFTTHHKTSCSLQLITELTQVNSSLGSNLSWVCIAFQLKLQCSVFFTFYSWDFPSFSRVATHVQFVHPTWECWVDVLHLLLSSLYLFTFLFYDVFRSVQSFESVRRLENLV